MFKKGLCSSRSCVLGALFLAMATFAQVTSPSKEFWDYMEEFGDQNGNLLDPLEYDLIADVKSDGSLVVEDEQDIQQETLSEKQLEKPTDKFKNRNADMKIEQQSSSQKSSAVMKGVQQ